MRISVNGKLHKVIDGVEFQDEPGALIKILRNNFSYKEYLAEANGGVIDIWYRKSEGEQWKYLGMVVPDPLNEVGARILKEE